MSYRSETLRLARAYPLINFGMDFVLGRPADDTLSAWAEMFVPMRLQQLIRSIRVRHSDGLRSQRWSRAASGSFASRWTTHRYGAR